MEQGLNSTEILSEIDNTHNGTGKDALRFNGWELDFLVDYIINNHHHYVREAIPVISAHSTKVASVHGKTIPKQLGCKNFFFGLQRTRSST